MNRLLNNRKTTFIGLIILCGSIAFVWHGKATMTEISGWMATAAMLFRAKDSILDPKK